MHQYYIYLYCSSHNVIISICDKNGNVIKQFSPASSSKIYRKSRRGSNYAGQQTAQQCLHYIYTNRLRPFLCHIRIKGDSDAGDGALTQLCQSNTGITVMSIVDITPMPHNGCRPPSQRRI
jgi:small subunit ribosomal protein S11